jgi:hypothetical protein
MSIIATLPSPYAEDLLAEIFRIPGLGQVRYNTGAATPESPKDTLGKLMSMSHLPLWVDLKCRQLRIASWSIPTYGDIELNHEIEVDLPARIYFRGGDGAIIRSIKGNRLFVDPPPKHAVGRGQSVNVLGTNLKIKGYLTDQDLEYIAAAKELGCVLFMASFVESLDDVKILRDAIPDGLLGLKIENQAGLNFLAENAETFKVWGEGCRLVAARDDLFINLEATKSLERFFQALLLMIKIDPEAILASRLMESFLTQSAVSLPDLSDALLMRKMGYKDFMLSDELNENVSALRSAVSMLRDIERWKE